MTIDTTPKSPLDGLVSCGACGAPMEYEAPTQDMRPATPTGAATQAARTVDRL